MSNKQSAGSSPSRRTVVKGAAWAVPAVVVASAAPAYALSGPLIPSYEPGSFCKHPGNNGYYHGVFCFDNTTTEDIVVTITTMTVTNTANAVPTAGDTYPAYFSYGEPEELVDTYTIPAGADMCLYVDAGTTNDSANGYAILNGSYVYDGDTYTVEVKAGKYVDNIPQALTVCGTNPVQDQPNDNPPHEWDGPDDDTDPDFPTP